MRPRAASIRSAARVLLPLAVLFIALFGEVIFHPRVFAFRDAIHFYYPLSQHITEAFHSGRVPLWDPAENLGQPLAANPAAAVFYPGKLIFLAMFLPGVSFGACFKWYVLGHFLLAYLAFYRFARLFGSSSASIFGALAYTFGGALFFQQTNPIFLVGAAWLPLASRGGVTLIDRPERFGVLKGAFPLAMMILGGDPQAAYIASVSLAGYFLYRRFSHRGVPAARPGARAALWLAAAFGVAALIAMVQILPSVEMVRLSNRASSREPVCVWDTPRAACGPEAGSARGGSLADGVLCRRIDRPTSRVGQIYRFSLPPWELLTMLLPRAGGDLYPQNSRLGAALNCGQGDWYGTLYFGLFPLLAALWALCRRREKNSPTAAAQAPIRSFMGILAVLLILGSLGAFGPCWLVRAITGTDSLTPRAGDPVGGVYWLMTQLLPGFASFRYPAKLMTCAALPLCALAVLGYDAFRAGPPVGRLGRVLYGLAVLVLLAVALVFFLPRGEALMAAAAPRVPVSLFGPLDSAAAARCLGGSALGAALLLAAAGFLPLVRHRLGDGWFDRSVLILLVLDLFLAGRWQVAAVPDSALSRPIALACCADSDGAPVRILRSGRLYPPRFLTTSSKNRPAELALWQRATLLSRFAAREGFADLFPSGTMTPDSYDQLKRELFPDPKSPSYPGPPAGERDSVLAFLDCRFLLLQSGRPNNFAAEPLKPDGGLPWPDGLDLRRTRTADGRVRIFHREFTGLSPLEELRERHLCRTPEGESARLADCRSETLTIQAELASAGYLTVCEQYWPGWRCGVTPIVDGRPDRSQTRAAEIRPCCGFLRRVDLPAGDWLVEMSYRPTAFYLGALISILTVVYNGAALWRRRKNSSRTGVDPDGNL